MNYINFAIKRVYFNDPVTVVIWKDGTKTIVRCDERDVYDPEKALAMAISKKALGNKGKYYDIFKKWIPEEKEYELPNISLDEWGDVLRNKINSIFQK